MQLDTYRLKFCYNCAEEEKIIAHLHVYFEGAICIAVEAVFGR